MLPFARSLWIAVLLLIGVSPAVTQWEFIGCPEGGVITCITGQDARLFAGTMGGGVFISSDDGESWRPASSTLEYKDVASLCRSGDYLLAGTNGAACSRSYSNYARWSPASKGMRYAPVSAMTTTGDLTFAGSRDGVRISDDHGSSWRLSNGGLEDSSVVGLDVTRWEDESRQPILYLATWGKGVYSSSDLGSRWVRARAGMRSFRVRSVYVLPERFLIRPQGLSSPREPFLLAATADGVYRSSDGGKLWMRSNTGPSDSDHVTCFAACASATVSGRPVLFAGSQNGIWRSTDLGDSWTVISRGLRNPSIRSMYSVGQTVFAGTDGAGVYRSRDLGESWESANKGLAASKITSMQVAGGSLLVGTHGNGLFRRSADQTQWISIGDLATASYVTALVCVYESEGSPLSAVLAGTTRGVFRSHDAGLSWHRWNEGLTDSSVRCLAATGLRVFAGTADGVFQGSTSGGAWGQSTPGFLYHNVTSLDAANDRVFAGTSSSGIFVSIDGGTHWSDRSGFLGDASISAILTTGSRVIVSCEGEDTGLFVSEATDKELVAAKDSVRGLVWLISPPWMDRSPDSQNGGIVSLIRIGGIVLAGADRSGGVMLSADGGDKWYDFGSGIGRTAVTCFSQDGSHLFLGTSGMGVYRRSLDELRSMAGKLQPAFQRIKSR
jgi:hypothetical protein